MSQAVDQRRARHQPATEVGAEAGAGTGEDSGEDTGPPSGGVWTRTLGEQRVYAVVGFLTEDGPDPAVVTFYDFRGQRLAEHPAAVFRAPRRIVPLLPDHDGYDLGPVAVRVVAGLVAQRAPRPTAASR